jgi:hypothetical protein
MEGSILCIHATAFFDLKPKFEQVNVALQHNEKDDAVEVMLRGSDTYKGVLPERWCASRINDQITLPVCNPMCGTGSLSLSLVPTVPHSLSLKSKTGTV